jgi:hypothetical protein
MRSRSALLTMTAAAIAALLAPAAAFAHVTGEPHAHLADVAGTVLVFVVLLALARLIDKMGGWR